MADGSAAKDKGVSKWLWWIPVLLAVIGLVTIIGVSNSKRTVGSTSYRIAADTQNIWPRIGETVKVKIYPDRLSGWINLPPGRKFVIDAPGEIEYFFWTGERILIKNKNTEWLGKVPNCSFRLRGTAGEATISIQ
ncbi:MAG: hypothetical protein Q8N22_02370 [bacterium]|nr:hypothetical protein [bacterium]